MSTEKVKRSPIEQALHNLRSEYGGDVLLEHIRRLEARAKSAEESLASARILLAQLQRRAK